MTTPTQETRPVPASVRSRHCLRCGYEWLPRKETRTDQCPRCHRRDWDKEGLKQNARRKVDVPFYERNRPGEGMGNP